MGIWGFDGSRILLNTIKSLNDEYVFFLDINELGLKRQTDQNVLNYVIDNGKKIDKYKNYEVYLLEGEV